jgi:hypothetical protein
MCIDEDIVSCEYVNAEVSIAFHDFRISDNLRIINQAVFLYTFHTLGVSDTHFVVFFTRCEVRLKKELSIEHIIEHNTIFWRLVL